MLKKHVQFLAQELNWNQISLDIINRALSVVATKNVVLNN